MHELKTKINDKNLQLKHLENKFTDYMIDVDREKIQASLDFENKINKAQEILSSIIPDNNLENIKTPNSLKKNKNNSSSKSNQQKIITKTNMMLRKHNSNIKSNNVKSNQESKIAIN